MAQLFLFSSALLSVGFLSGCAAIVPHTLMTPAVRQRGELEVGTSVGLHGISLQSAYAPTSQTVLLASGHYLVRGGRWSWAGEAGGGRQWIKLNGGSWALYGGAGLGAAYSYDGGIGVDRDNIRSERVRYIYTFIQPTYTLLLDGRTSIGFAVRVQPLRLNRWETSTSHFGIDSLRNVYTEQNTINQAGRWVLLLQPGINVRRTVSRRLCFTSSLSVFRPLQEKKAPTTFGLAVGVGLQFTVGSSPTPNKL